MKTRDTPFGVRVAAIRQRKRDTAALWIGQTDYSATEHDMMTADESFVIAERRTDVDALIDGLRQMREELPE